MDEQQQAELKARLDKVESDLLTRLDQLEGRNKSWLARNIAIIAPIISAIIVLATIFIAWGRMEMTVANLHEADTRMQTDIATEKAAIRAHHEDVTRHVDASWKAEIRSDLNSIRQLLIEHMSDGRPARAR